MIGHYNSKEENVFNNLLDMIPALFGITLTSKELKLFPSEFNYLGN